MKNIGGTLPQNNIRFLQSFKKMIEEKIQNKDKKILVDMSLTMTECKENLFDVLLDNGKRIIHIILVGEEDTIKFRIKNDNKRDKQLALEELKYNLCFLKENFDDVTSILVINNFAPSKLTIEEQSDITERALENYDEFDYIIANDDLAKTKEKVFKIYLDFIKKSIIKIEYRKRFI